MNGVTLSVVGRARGRCYGGTDRLDPLTLILSAHLVDRQFMYAFDGRDSTDVNKIVS